MLALISSLAQNLHGAVWRREVFVDDVVRGTGVYKGSTNTVHLTSAGM